MSSRLRLTSFKNLKIGQHFYGGVDRNSTFQKVTETGWRILLFTSNKKLVPTRINKMDPQDDMVLIDPEEAEHAVHIPTAKDGDV